ncbi:MAG: GNAT family N-acetyltransferase [Phascolarctobacterium sp.]|nr:GNAT family N-acetyltransferase [Phascolarctobacterium sp.]
MVRNVRLEGKYVIVEEISPKYFEKVIEWRNNPELNKFLNQPYKLTLELQQKWYEKYLTDFTQGLFVAVDKETGKPLATMGYTDYNAEEKVLISGRLLVGEIEYRGSKEWQEVAEMVFNYYYQSLGVNIVYAHIVKENIASIKWHKKWGFKENYSHIKYPSELLVNEMKQDEYLQTSDSYNSLKFKLGIL